MRWFEKNIQRKELSYKISCKDEYIDKKNIKENEYDKNDFSC